MSMPRSVLRQALFGWVHFALAAPGIYLWLGLPLVMRQHGWSGTEIGIFQLAGLPAVFKLVFALPVQRWRPGRHPERHWAWLSGAGYLLALLGLAWLGIDAHKGVLFTLTLLAALFATWTDIPVSALTMQVFPPQERPLAGAVRSAVTFAGAVVGGGVMLLVQQWLGWSAPFLILGVCLLAALALLGLVQEDSSAPGMQGLPSIAAWHGFFRQPGAGGWTLALLGFFPFVAAAWIYLKPLLLDRGLPASGVALIAGVGGGALGALASIATGLLPRERMQAALSMSAVANAIALALMAAAAAYATAPWLIAAAVVLAIAMGVASSLVFGLMMEFSRSSLRALDYGLQASLFTCSRILATSLAGLLLDQWGYPGMLTALALASLPITLAMLMCFTQQRSSHSRYSSHAGS